MISAEKISARGHRHSSLAIHPYFGKVDPGIVQHALQAYAHDDAVVLDPFCGSGTVLHDALLAKRAAIGFDSSPLACMIATAKVLGITAQEVEELRRLSAEICVTDDLFTHRSTPPPSSVPAMPRIRSVEHWFTENALKELAAIKAQLDANRPKISPEVALLADVAFSRIITPASRQKGESTYSRVNKDDYPGRVKTLFRRSVDHVIRSASAFNAELASQDFPPPSHSRLTVQGSRRRVRHGSGSVDICCVDARLVEACRDFGLAPADLIVTSPPYLMSWDYGLYHKFRFYWLGLDLDHYEETEIGRHLRRKDDDVERYQRDMEQVLRSLGALVSENATAVLVNAPSVVHGELVDTNELITACAARQGWTFLDISETLNIPGPHHGMYASLKSRQASAPGAAGKREHVILLQWGGKSRNLGSGSGKSINASKPKR